MAYSKDLIPTYIKNGYKSVIIDIDNISIIRQKKTNHTSSNPLTYKIKNLDVIFASSFLFQEFQNCVYEMCLSRIIKKTLMILKKICMIFYQFIAEMQKYLIIG